MPKKKSVSQKPKSVKKPGQTVKIVKKAEPPKKPEKPVEKPKSPIQLSDNISKKPWLIPAIVLASVGVLFILLIIIGIYLYYSSLEVPEVPLTPGENVQDASYTGDIANVVLSEDVNLNNVKTIDIVFSDGENDHVYSAPGVSQEYEIYASDLGLENFDEIVSVSASVTYEQEEVPPEDTPGPPTEKPTEPPDDTPDGGGGGGGGGGDDGGDDGCTDECSGEGFYCDGNKPYECFKEAGGCLQKSYLTDCLQGEECKNGECIPAKCTSDDNCTSDGCYDGNFRDYYCNSSEYCDYYDLTEIENSTNLNCNNSIDDDCDTLIDANDSGCQGIGGCGDNIASGEDEVCDGTDLAGKSCLDFGYQEGTLGCCEDCMNFDLCECYNLTYGACYDWDSGKKYEIPSNATQALDYDYGGACPNSTCSARDNPSELIELDECSGTVLTEYFCNTTTNRINSVEYDCAVENKTCENGACVGVGVCGNEYCDGGIDAELQEGESVNMSFNARDYTVKLTIVISDVQADILVNTNTATITEGHIQTVDSLPVHAIDVFYPSHTNETSFVKLFLGENNITCPEDCLCTPDCTGKECGDDGCGGTCGTCNTGESCIDGTCIPDCTDTCISLGYECGNQTICDTLTNCGVCVTGESCIDGACVPMIEIPSRSLTDSLSKIWEWLTGWF